MEGIATGIQERMNITKLKKLAAAIASNPLVRIAAVRIVDVAIDKLTKKKR